MHFNRKTKITLLTTVALGSLLCAGGVLAQSNSSPFVQTVMAKATKKSSSGSSKKSKGSSKKKTKMNTDFASHHK